ncbi:synapse differentiation-inducing gene protein 1-like, partial [Lampetra planeri]
MTSQPKDLIRTYTLGAEPQAALSLYLAPQYQSHLVVRTTPQQDAAGGGGAPQPLNPSSLLPQQAAAPHFRHAPDFLQYSENLLQVWGEGGVSDCCETTFIEGVSQDTSSTAVASCADEQLLFADGNLLDFSGEDPKIHTLSQDVDDDEFQELESEYSSESESEDAFLLMPPRDHLGLSVFSMLCCFWPLGIAAFYLSHE